MKTAIMTAFFAAILPQSTFSQDAATAFFAEWDLDRNGAVTTLEARSTLTRIFSEFDTNLDGFLDDNDGFEDEAGVAPQGPMTLAFDDNDGDGRVSLLEFINQDGEWIALMDRDSDGMITANDFGLL